MSHVIATFALLLLTFTFSAYAPPAPPPPPPLSPSPPPPPGFSLIVFQWGKGLCKATSCTTAPTMLEFTIHGLWPQDPSGKPLLNCKGVFDKNLLQSMIGDLENFWPSFQKPNDAFWEHEWLKHGTCSNQPQVTYFQNAIGLADKWRPSLMTGLKTQGVSPSPTQSYVIQQIMDGIAIAVGNNPKIIYQLQCKTSANTKYLVEVRLCVDNTLQNLITCPQTAKALLLGCGKLSDTALFYD